MCSPLSQSTSHVGLHVIPRVLQWYYKTLLIKSFPIFGQKLNRCNHSWLLGYDAHFGMKSDKEVCLTGLFFMISNLFKLYFVGRSLSIPHSTGFKPNISLNAFEVEGPKPA